MARTLLATYFNSLTVDVSTMIVEEVHTPELHL